MNCRPAPANSLRNRKPELDDERKALGVADELRNVDGITTAMMVTLGKDDIKSLEDFAGCAVDDLCGWTERKDGEVKRFEGTVEGFQGFACGSRTNDHAGAYSCRLGYRGRTDARRKKAEEGAEAVKLQTCGFAGWRKAKLQARALERLGGSDRDAKIGTRTGKASGPG